MGASGDLFWDDGDTIGEILPEETMLYINI